MAKKAVITRTLVGCAIGATGILTLAGPVSAQESQSCQVASFAGFQFLNPETPLSPVSPIDLDAGTVSITEAHSWDSYPARVNIDQASEIWQVEFVGSDGSIVGISAPSQDLEDLVEEAHWFGSLGDVTLSAPAVGVRARHLPGTEGDFSKNSVHASEITICVDVVAPTTTTTTAPTTTTTAPTTTAPTTAPPPSGPTVTEPTTTTAPDPKGPTTSEPAPKGPTLPVTGSETSLLLMGGMWLLAAGSSLVAFGRTR